ncbi:MAG: LLM class flavin-dependent oxidoreductase [Candidatus Tectomicrobia bacterium]|nr:LLM class flavin-dependent oxidoreductase [Candidatus Tectomicrobia bacterium]
MTSTFPRPEPRFDWFIPIDGDGEHIGTLRAERPPTFTYLREVVQTAEDCGFYSLLIPTRFGNGLFEEKAPLAETWTTATALAAVTKRIRFLVAVRPGFISPGLFAQMAATLDQISGGRLDLNIVPGGIQNEFERFGEQSDHAFRYARAEEFIAACRKLWEKPEPVDFAGEYIKLNGAFCSPGPVGKGPVFYLGGASDRALALAGRQADVLLTWIEPQDQIAARLKQATQFFKAANRTSSFGLRTHLIVKSTEAEAWEAANELLSQAHSVVRQQRQVVFTNTPMVGQRAQAKEVEDYRLGPHLWNGISQVRVNCGTALVGTPDQVSEELLGYWRLGVDEFILSGYPHVETCRETAAELLPLLRERIEREPVRVTAS